MTGARRAIPHLFAHWDDVAQRIRENKRVAIFLDFDGTLARIAPKPGDARLKDETRKILRKLAARRNVMLSVVSGRQRAELRKFIGVQKVKCMGLYGWERSDNQSLPFDVRLTLAGTLARLWAELRVFPGVWIEPKRNSFSVHLRGASEDARRQVRQRVMRRVQPLRATLQVMANLRDLEVAPLSIGNKGLAVRKALAEAQFHGALPIYFGDDLSDEPAFEAARHGISILVGKRRTTRAVFSLRGPAEVTTALSRIEEVFQ